MIIQQLSGGIGNQLFQYSLGKYLAKKNNSRLKLDINIYLNKNEPRKFLLNKCFSGIEIASAEEIKLIRPEGWLNRMMNILSGRVIKEKSYYFDPSILDVRDNSYLIGYWQSYKYSAEIIDELRSEFSLISGRSENVSFYEEQIRHANSISIHIRRGDYVTTYSSMYHVLDMEYYLMAMEEISKNNVDPMYFIFSDDFHWVRDNFKLGNNYLLVEGNESFEDLYLMSLCKHNIIANSSFSWWAAQLNINPKKEVVAPKLWFKTFPINESDLFQDDWIVI